MKIVIDSNRIIAALMKDGTTRKIIFTDLFEFIAPDFIKFEVNKYRNMIMRRSEICSEEFDYLVELLFEHIEVLPIEAYFKFLKKSSGIISDGKDAPYIAVYLFTNSDGIWSHDNHFFNLDGVKVFSNIDMLNFLGS